MINEKKIGLSLSGGGYRATAYHLGTLKKLNELNILEDIDIISTVSGGSITGAYYGLYGNDFEEFEKRLVKGIQSSVIKGVLLSSRFIFICAVFLGVIALIIYFLFANYAWLSFTILVSFLLIIIKYQFRIFPVSKIIENLYNRLFFNKLKLKDFKSKAVIAINSTNLETGTPFTFSKNKMSDSSYQYPKDRGKAIEFNPGEFPIARAVAASACVPFAFTPVEINKSFFKNPSDFNRISPRLIDGGVYDNQGIHKITQKSSSYKCNIVITSDAGNLMPSESIFKNTITLLKRTSNLFMNRIKNFQLIQHVYENNRTDIIEIAYQSLGWDIENCIPGFINNLKKGLITDQTVKSHGITKKQIEQEKWEEITQILIYNSKYEDLLKEAPSKDELKLIRSIETNLTALSNAKINALVKQAYSITELQVRLYCPSLFINDTSKP